MKCNNCSKQSTPEPPEDSGEELYIGPTEVPFTLETQTESKRGHLEREDIAEEQQTQRHRVHGMDKVKVVAGRQTFNSTNARHTTYT